MGLEFILVWAGAIAVGFVLWRRVAARAPRSDGGHAASSRREVSARKTLGVLRAGSYVLVMPLWVVVGVFLLEVQLEWGVLAFILPVAALTAFWWAVARSVASATRLHELRRGQGTPEVVPESFGDSEGLQVFDERLPAGAHAAMLAIAVLGAVGAVALKRPVESVLIASALGALIWHFFRRPGRGG